MKKSFTPLYINDNKLTISLDNEEVVLFLYHNKDINYEDKVFEEAKGTLEVKINPFNDDIIYENVFIDNYEYILENETMKIYNLNKKNLKLNITGTFPIIITSIELSPLRKMNVNGNFIEKKFSGFKFNYSFEDNLASDSSFYLALLADSNFNISPERANADIDKLMEIVNLCFKEDTIRIKRGILEANLSVINEIKDNISKYLSLETLKANVVSFANKKGDIIVSYKGLKENNKKLTFESTLEETKKNSGMLKAKTREKRFGEDMDIRDYEEGEEDYFDVEAIKAEMGDFDDE